ncbi:MAG: PD40 domain-containing protein [Bacteroidales bacterium]|nr:PD40 domain-containing protein [Bacteroidales bacterium]
MRTLLFTIFIFILLSGSVDAQRTDFVPEGSLKAARGYFQYQNFKDAMAEYLKLSETDSTNMEYHHNIGLCYLYTNIDKTLAIPYLEWVVEQEKFDPNAWYDLGRAYQYAYRFDDARRAFKKFISSGEKDMNPISAKRQLEICDNAEKIIASPLNVTFTNLGEDINSPYPDYNPFILQDESYLVYVSKRNSNLGGWIDYDGFNTADIYHTTKTGRSWKKSRGISNTINTYLVEEIVGMTPDGEIMFVYMDNEYAMADVFYSEKRGRSYKRPEALGTYVNAKSFEGAATISQNKKILFFSSNREGGKGGMDLYMAYQLPTGEWGDPTNLGDLINTEYDEDFPYFAPDGESFYFASTGHNSMGGYDIFKCKWNKKTKTFDKPINVGYPINTVEDNTTISFSESMRHAYMAALKPGGYGELDIYRVTFNDVEPKKCFLSGIILTPDSISLFDNYNKLCGQKVNLQNEFDTLISQMNMEDKIDTISIEMMHPGIFEELQFLTEKTKELPQITIKVTNTESKEIQGIYRPNKNTGKYIIIVEPGSYEVLFSCPGYQSTTKEYFFIDDESNSVYNNEHIILIPEN